jgi:hypothetical protein
MNKIVNDYFQRGRTLYFRIFFLVVFAHLETRVRVVFFLDAFRSAFFVLHRRLLFAPLGTPGQIVEHLDFVVHRNRTEFVFAATVSSRPLLLALIRQNTQQLNIAPTQLTCSLLFDSFVLPFCGNGIFEMWILPSSGADL